MGSILFDLRDALRSLRRDRAYAATVVLTLAVTIGATTAVFSIVDGVLLKPLAFRDSHQLVALREIWREFADRFPSLEVNERHFEYWREHAKSFDGLAQYVALPANLTGSAEAARITVVRTSGSLFDVLGVHAAAGRLLTPDDDRKDRADVAVITDRLWRQRLGANPSIVGESIALDGRSYAVVGVLPPGFRLPDREQLTDRIDAFVPLRPSAGWVGDHNNQAIGRLRPGVTADQARSELEVLQTQVSGIATREAHEPVTLSAAVMPLTDAVVGSSRRGLVLLFAAIVAVLLIACANLANLLLTRTMSHLRDAAIRSALGASRARLVWRGVAEQLLLSASGGALGLWVAWLSLALFVRTAPIDLPRVNEVALDARVLAFAALTTVGSGLLVALLPALRVARRDVEGMLRAGAVAIVGGRGGVRSRSVLLALQVATSVTLLVVTALLTASFLRVVSVDRGFSDADVLAVDVALPSSRYAEEPARLAAFDRMLADVQAIPGVATATTTSMLPLRGQGQVNFIVKDGAAGPRSEQPTANFRMVAPDFFKTLGIVLKQGRSFAAGERDPKRPTPAVISEPAAQRLWPGENPLGKRFSRGIPGEAFEVVGVAADARLTAVDRRPPLMVYVPYWWQRWTFVSLLVKMARADSAASADPDAVAREMVPAIRRVVHDIDPEIAVGESRLVSKLVESSFAARRYQAQLFVMFGVVALFIAAVGIYAATSYGVSRRRREMNIRAALGADPAQILGLVVRQSSAPIAAGAAAGIAGALAVGGIVASLLFDVRPRDPIVIAAVTAVVTLVGLASATAAARRGLSVDPAAALRED